MPFRTLDGFHPIELKRIEKYLEGEDVDLHSFDIGDELKKISTHPLYRELVNDFDVYPKDNPVRLVLGEYSKNNW